MYIFIILCLLTIKSAIDKMNDKHMLRRDMTVCASYLQTMITAGIDPRRIMTVYTENVVKKRLTDQNYAMSVNGDQNQLTWAIDDNYEYTSTGLHGRTTAERNDVSGLLASNMSDNISQGYLNMEQCKGNDSANYSQYYLREWEVEALCKLSMRNENQAEELEWSPAPPEAFEIGKDFVIDGQFEVETELANALDNMILNKPTAPDPSMQSPQYPDQNYYLFNFTQNEAGGEYIRGDPFPFKEVDTTYSP